MRKRVTVLLLGMFALSVPPAANGGNVEGRWRSAMATR